MRVEPRTVYITAVAMVLFTAALGTVLTFATSSRSSEPTPPVAAAGKDVTSEFSVFRRAQRADDVVSPNATEKIQHADNAQRGENPGLSRAARTPKGDIAGYVWPKSDGVCFSVLGASTCMALADVEQAGGISTLTFESPDVGPDRVRLAGVAVDGISAVVVTTPSGETSVPVSDNFFSVDLSAAPSGATGLRWSRSGEQHQARIG